MSIHELLILAERSSDDSSHRGELTAETDDIIGWWASLLLEQVFRFCEDDKGVEEAELLPFSEDPHHG